MQKKLTVALIAALVLTVFAAAGAFAACPKGADQKAGCMHGKDAMAACPQQKDMMAAMEALQKDLATMEKGIPAADQAAFMKSHEANLKKLMDLRAACMKECKAKAEMKEAPKAAAEPAKEAPKK